MKPILLTFALSMIAFSISAQVEPTPANNAAEYEEEYRQRIRREVLYGVYIPKDLAEAFVQLNKLTEPSARQTFATLPEQAAYRELFHSFGRWIIVNWGFYGGSRLSHYLRQMGLTHPEDMAEMVITTYHRHLNKRPLDPKPLVEQILERRREQWRQRVQQGTVVEETVRKREKG